MIYKEHLIELWVNKEKVELESQESLNLRFNNVINNPEVISSTQAEYSFSFDVPATPKNNRIFDYANNLAKLNKFHQRYQAQVIADGDTIFTGTLVVNSFSDNKYNLNLVSVKVYSLEDIFGDKAMNKIKWRIPFEGGGSGDYSMDYYNSQLEPEVTFPLVSYGVFQKSPYNSDDVANDYTSKFDMDEWNRWYVESFPPSPNMLQTVKKAFETVDYTVTGDVFKDKFLREIYLSQNLADGQSPDYNVGNPKFGHVELTSSYSTVNQGNGYQQELRFPYYKVHGVTESGINPEGSNGIEGQTYWNWNSVNLYNLLDSGGTVSAQNSYMYQPYEHLIVIPADGFYRIELRANVNLVTTGNITVKQNLYNKATRTFSESDVTVPVSLQESTPVEIQLVRNYDDNLELIKGKHNRQYADGNPNNTQPTNYTEWLTCYPHEDPYNSLIPSKLNDLTSTNRTSQWGGQRTSSNGTVGERGSFDGEGRKNSRRGASSRRYSTADLGYVYNNGQIMAYDPVVSSSFICGLSSNYDGVASVIKNGYSWSKLTAEKYDAFYDEMGYAFLKRETDGSTSSVTTRYNQNQYINTPNSYCNVTQSVMNGYVSCLVWLNKNDVLNLFEVHRSYDSSGGTVNYTTTSNVSLSITAYSPRSFDLLKADNANRYDGTIEFDNQLNINNFFNQDVLIKDWIQNIADAYNLDIIQEGKTVTINTKKKYNNKLLNAVNIDDRCNSANAKSSMINYPKSMAVKYSIDTDEWGFERSAVANAGGSESILNEEDWEKYGDSGYTIIELNDDTYVTSTSDKNLSFSYTWYQPFNWYNVDNQFVKQSDTPVVLRIPCISKYSYMIDGYSYEESMKHDGYGQPQRFWFRPSAASCWVWLRSYPTERVQLYTPSNLYTNYQDVYFNLSYKTTERSILTDYFNINAYLSSNYVEVDVYLSPDEYNRIKNGSLIFFDSDLYLPVEISGFDCSGVSPTNLKMMKKVV